MLGSVAGVTMMTMITLTFPPMGSLFSGAAPSAVILEPLPMLSLPIIKSETILYFLLLKNIHVLEFAK